MARTPSYRFRLGRFYPSRVVHVGCPDLALALQLAAIYRRAVGYARQHNTCGRPAAFAVH
jgi:hypothetical protein